MHDGDVERPRTRTERRENPTSGRTDPAITLPAQASHSLSITLMPGLAKGPLEMRRQLATYRRIKHPSGIFQVMYSGWQYSGSCVTLETKCIQCWLDGALVTGVLQLNVPGLAGASAQTYVIEGRTGRAHAEHVDDQIEYRNISILQTQVELGAYFS